MSYTFYCGKNTAPNQIEPVFEFDEMDEERIDHTGKRIKNPRYIRFSCLNMSNGNYYTFMDILDIRLEEGEPWHSTLDEFEKLIDRSIGTLEYEYLLNYAQYLKSMINVGRKCGATLIYSA